MFFLVTEKSRNRLYSANSYLMSGVVVMVFPKNSISNETRIFAESRQGKWIWFFDLELEQVLFYVKNLPSWNTTDFIYYLSYIIAMKNFVIFYLFIFLSSFKASITHLSINFSILESLFSKVTFRKEFPIFPTFYLPCQRNMRALLMKV